MEQVNLYALAHTAHVKYDFLKAVFEYNNKVAKWKRKLRMGKKEKKKK